MGYGTDRTFSAQQWRVVVASACAILIAGVGLGVLIGRMTAAPPEPPPASASIIPDVPPATVTAAAPDGVPDEEPDQPAPAVATAPAPVKAPPAPPALVLKALPPPDRVAAVPKPERPARPRPVEAKAKPAPPEPEPPANGPRWVVQLGAFQSADHANLLVNTLAAHGQRAHVTFVRNADGQGWFYVQTLPYRSAAAAKTAAQSLAAREHLPTYLIKLPTAG
jgi:cell division septation protein DedD